MDHPHAKSSGVIAGLALPPHQEKEAMYPPSPVLYLDYDGVLHHEDVIYIPKTGPVMRAPGERLFAHCDLLIELLDPAPDLVIVLSTSWSVKFGTVKAALYLPRELRQRVIDRTMPKAHSKRAFLALSRGQQIFSDVCRRQPPFWFAIDDCAAGFPPEHVSRLVHTNEQRGLNDEAAILRVKEEIQRITTRSHDEH